MLLNCYEFFVAEWKNYEWDQFPSKKGKKQKSVLSLLVNANNFGNDNWQVTISLFLGNATDGREQAAKAASTHLTLCL